MACFEAEDAATMRWLFLIVTLVVTLVAAAYFGYRDLSLFGASKKKSFLASAKLLEESAIWLSHGFQTRSWIGLQFCVGQNLPLKQDCRDEHASDLLYFFTFFQPFFPPIQKLCLDDGQQQGYCEYDMIGLDRAQKIRVVVER
ncbi:hypothetical protein NC653_020524 [Populus alba x Populus x berolinensis]|uniref:Uncharacterized protein n=1 Tax=Populus alba x Populus x berolinensis TaxID=444605 RepID=A0AAD6QDU9_9ROSI|nr:hypothetical protein NC653_020524 [Populus alba x Populus x berolinensis]